MSSRRRSSVRWLRSAAMCALALMALLAPAARATPRNKRLRSIHTWAFAIGTGDLSGDVLKRYSPYDLVVVDGQEASARQVRALRQAGKLVLAYLDVGTIEAGRPWYAQAKAYRLGYWGAWGEWYANVDAAGFRRLIERNVATGMLHKGFDGLFLDNTDMIESYPRQTGGMRRLVRSLARLVHGERGLLFAQNGEDSMGPLIHYYDGWNREDVFSTYDFTRHRYVRQAAGDVSYADTALRRIARAGLLTLSTDYVAAGDAATAAAAIRNSCSTGTLPFVSNIELTRIPAVPPRCGP